MNYKQCAEKTVRTAWVKAWTSEFLKGLAPLDNQQAIKHYCLERKQDLITICQEKSLARAKQQGKTVNPNSWKNAIANHISQIRKAIQVWQQWAIDQGKLELNQDNSYPQQTKTEVVRQHLALLHMNLPSDFHRQRQQPTQEKKQQQRHNLQAINCVDQYQNTIDKLLQSRDYRELAVGLIAATGRRPSEILKTAQFEQIGQFEVDFTGQLKAKGKTGTYATFTLVESAKVVDGITRLRRMPEIKELKKKTLAQIDSGRNSTVNTKVKAYFAPLVKPPTGESELSSKNLRAVYAAIAIYLFCPWQQSTNQFITERLGHDNDVSATNYEDYQITDSQGKPLTRGAWLERVREQMMEVKQIVHNYRLRISQTDKEVLDDLELLPYADQASRMSELVRLAKIGKQFEEGKLVKEVVKVVEVEKIVEVPSAQVKHKPFDQMSNEELMGSHIPGSTDEKLLRAVQAIKTYNEGKAKEQMWAINTKSLKDLTGCRTEALKRFLASDTGRLQVHDYNARWEFGYHHNRGRGSVTDVVKL